jgi:hypothetical protein
MIKRCALSLALCCSVPTGCGGSNGSTAAPAPVATRTPSPVVLSNVPVPANAAYFGAWANPSGVPQPSPAQIEAFTETLESQLGRTLRLHMHYYNWASGSAPSFPDQAMTYDATYNRIPLVTWKCGDSDANVYNGNDDALLTATAQAVKAYKLPIFIRWYWEMNLKPGANGQDCLGSDGPGGYIKAWQHITALFRQQGATNVSWLWNPAGAAQDADSKPYYPGDAYVDWIGFDGYDKVGANTFPAIFSPFYTEFNSNQKPILIAETGECPAQQAPYIASAQASIDTTSGTGEQHFPLVHGFMYFDAPGHFDGCSWIFEQAGTAAFARMGSAAYFNP